MSAGHAFDAAPAQADAARAVAPAPAAERNPQRFSLPQLLAVEEACELLALNRRQRAGRDERWRRAVELAAAQGVSREALIEYARHIGVYKP